MEFALTFPLLLLVVMGIIDFGFFFREYLVVTDAASEGARLGLLTDYGAAEAEARALAYMEASGLSGGVAVASHGQLADGSCSIEVTARYPHHFGYFRGIFHYFDEGQANDKMVTGISKMRRAMPTPGPGGACPP